ncbi:MAG: hypothetical protein LC099_05895 [Anaerolineales bacterium]|nr:hypothetical protein [Anaerolineales bacterium]
MPRLSAYYVRAAFLYMLVGLTFGGLLLANKGWMFLPSLWTTLPVHIEISLIGWLVQLAMGVAFWVLPRFPKPPIRGDERLTWAAFFLLNAGIWLVVLQAFFPLSWQIGWLTFFGRTLELAAFVLFVVGNWKRVKPLGM